MTNRIQAERLAEYMARKDASSSYLDFINARVKGSELAKSLLGGGCSNDAGIAGS
jgi:hypothetical protein